MKNLLDELRDAGLSDNEARKSIEVVYEWVEERYPVLAAVARTTVRREMNPPEIEETKKTKIKMPLRHLFYHGL